MVHRLPLVPRLLTWFPDFLVLNLRINFLESAHNSSQQRHRLWLLTSLWVRLTSLILVSQRKYLVWIRPLPPPYSWGECQDMDIPSWNREKCWAPQTLVQACLVPMAFGLIALPSLACRHANHRRNSVCLYSLYKNNPLQESASLEEIREVCIVYQRFAGICDRTHVN